MCMIIFCVCMVKFKYGLGKKETIISSSLIAFICLVESFSIYFQMFITIEYKKDIYHFFSLLAFLSMIFLNIYNFYYIKYYVVDPNAIKETKLGFKKVKKLEELYKKSQKRRAAYEAAMANEAKTNPEMAAALEAI